MIMLFFFFLSVFVRVIILFSACRDPGLLCYFPVSTLEIVE
jgi:hypothetical protein